MTRLCYFWGYFQTGYLHCRRKTLTPSIIAKRRLFLRKKRIRETTELLLGRCKNDFVHFWVETKFGKPVLILCWHCCKRMHKRYKVPHHIRCFQMDNAFGMVVLSWICARQGLAQISLSSFRWYSWDCEVCHQSKTFAFSKRNLRAQKQTAVFKVIVTERRFCTVKFIQSSRWLVRSNPCFPSKCLYLTVKFSYKWKSRLLR